MTYHNTYIVTKRFRAKAICGDLNLPYGTECQQNNGFIIKNGAKICAVTSQNAYDYFSQNDDGCGKERGELTQTIIKRLQKLSGGRKDNVWSKIWVDSTCLKYKRVEMDDHWLWNYDFYNAPISDLKYILNLINKG